MYESAIMALWPQWPASDWHGLLAWRTRVNDVDSNGSDGQLMRRLRAGERPAFLEFYDRYAGLLLSVAARVLGSRPEAEDVLQDVCTQIWRHPEGYDAGLGSLAGWAVTLTRNKAIDRIRASSRQRRLVEEVALGVGHGESAGASANDLVYGKEVAARVRAALDALSGEQREVIELAFFAGLSQTEIASRLEQPLGTVKARIRRGMLKLREELGGIL
jgi:RNA polymerase sigma-70 factor, ECF subfamily